MARDSQNQHQPGTPDCPVPQAGLVVNWSLSGIGGATWLKITGLSGESSAPAPKYIGDELVALGKSPRTLRLKFTGLSGESEPPEPTVNSAISGRRVARANGRLGTPDYSVCTGQRPVRQRDRRPNGRMHQIRKRIEHWTTTGAVRWCTGYHSIEGKICLPS